MWREVAVPVGEPRKAITPEEREKILRKHGMRFKPD